MTGFVYLAALLVSSLGMLTIDYRYKLFFFARPRIAAAIMAVGVIGFLLWDAAGIGLGIFLRGDAFIATGIVLAPHMPLEEPIFLAFLVLCTMVIYTGALRIIHHVRNRRWTKNAPSRETSYGASKGQAS